MYEKRSLKTDLNPKNLIDYFKYKIQFMRDHPDYFYPDGLLVFTGAQGTGKTLSAVEYVCNLMANYPKAILVTNIQLTKYPFDNTRVFPFKNNDDFKKYSNGECGVIFLVDEIQLYLNSLESKNINMDVMVQISQQRKQRKHIVATSQVFSRLAKPLREQFSDVVVCKNYFKFLQINKVINRDSVEMDENSTGLSGKVIGQQWFFHSPKYYNTYDTYYIIDRNKFVSNEEKKVNIYDVIEFKEE